MFWSQSKESKEYKNDPLCVVFREENYTEPQDLCTFIGENIIDGGCGEEEDHPQRAIMMWGDPLSTSITYPPFKNICFLYILLKSKG